MYQSFARIIPALLLSVLLAGCASFTNEIEQESRQDAETATRIKARLLDHPALAAAAIQVSSDQGRVTLSGFVETEEQKRQAARVAQGVESVDELVNEIVVK